MEYELLSAKHDKEIANLIRHSLKARHLDIPGTAYYDKGLDHLSKYYSAPKRKYYVLLENGAVIGGIGIAEFEGFKNTCELQKLYLSDNQQGKGLGYKLISFIESKAKELGFEHIYLETHTNLTAAIHIYEKCGYKQIPKPKTVVHSTMNRFYAKDLI